MKFPIFNSFKAESYLKAFLLNALVGGLITALAIEVRLILDDTKSDYYLFWSMIYRIKVLKRSHKLLTTFITTFIIALITYHLFFFLFFYGGGKLNLVKTNNIITLESLTKSRRIM
jgi:hypothetical protein